MVEIVIRDKSPKKFFSREKFIPIAMINHPINIESDDNSPSRQVTIEITFEATKEDVRQVRVFMTGYGPDLVRFFLTKCPILNIMVGLYLNKLELFKDQNHIKMICGEVLKEQFPRFHDLIYNKKSTNIIKKDNVIYMNREEDE